MPPIILKVSEETFAEVANALEAQGKKVNPEENITLQKDVSVKGPIDWRTVKVKIDILEHIKHVYEPRMNDDGTLCLTDSNHFINFFDDVYNYIMKGIKPLRDTPDNVTPIKQDKAKW